MKKSILAVVAGILVVAAGGAYYGIEVYPQQQFRAGLDQTLANLPFHATGTYKDAHYSLFSRKAVISGLALHATVPGQADAVSVTFATVNVDNVNPGLVAAWRDAQEHKAALAPDTAIPVADAVSFTGFAVQSRQLTFTQDSGRADKIRVYPWALAQDGMPDLQQIQAVLTPTGRPPTLADLLPLLRAEAAAMLTLGYDGYVTGATKATMKLPTGDITYQIDKTAVQQFDRGVLHGASADGISGTSRGGPFSVTHMTMGGTDLWQPLTQIVKGAPITAALLDGVRIEPIVYEGMTATPPGRPLMHLGSMTLGPVSFAHGLPVTAAFNWRDLQVTRAQLPDVRSRAGMAQLGLDTLTISLAIAYTWDPTRHSATLHDTMLKVNELGTLSLSADLTGVEPNLAALPAARLAHAKLRFDDASMLGRVVTWRAAMLHTTPEIVRQQAALEVQQRVAAAGLDNPRLVQWWQAVGALVQSPHSLTVELTPPSPVTYADIRETLPQPDVLVTMLGLVTTANQP